MQTKYRSRILGILAALAVVAAAIVPELRHQSGTLLQRAHKIAAVGAWDPKQDNYFWLSNNEVLLVTQAALPAYEENASVAVRRLEVASGTQAEDFPLEALLHNVGGDSVASNWQLSPDARWLLSGGQFKNQPLRWIATAVDGSKQVVRPRQSAYEENGIFSAWRPDSKSWIQVVSENTSRSDGAGVFVYALNSSAVVHDFEDFMPNGRTVLGFYSLDRALAIYPRTGDGGGIGYVDFPATAGAAPRTIYYQHIPPNFDVQEVVLSPDRAHLAWKFGVKPLPLGLQSTINSSYVRRSAPDKVGLWVSDLNCGNLREVGTLDIRDDHLSNLRWTPDGTHLSFIDDGALYAVPTSGI